MELLVIHWIYFYISIHPSMVKSSYKMHTKYMKRGGAHSKKMLWMLLDEPSTVETVGNSSRLLIRGRHQTHINAPWQATTHYSVWLNSYQSRSEAKLSFPPKVNVKIPSRSDDTDATAASTLISSAVASFSSSSVFFRGNLQQSFPGLVTTKRTLIDFTRSPVAVRQ